MIQAKAFIFDLNGTMIDDMDYHLRAWHDILNNELGANLSREAVKSEMYGKNAELLVRIFGPHRFTPEEMDAISMQKEIRYQEAFFPHLTLLPGLTEFLNTSWKKKILMAIGSAAIPFNINFVVDNLNIRHYFKAIVSADDVKISKPDPETFLKAAALLKVDPSSCVVFEDAPKGVECALRAGMQCVVLTTMHEKEAFPQDSKITAFIHDYSDPYLLNLF